MSLASSTVEVALEAVLAVAQVVRLEAEQTVELRLGPKTAGTTLQRRSFETYHSLYLEFTFRSNTTALTTDRDSIREP